MTNNLKIAILSRNPKGYSNRRFKEAAADRGHKIICLDTLKFSMSIEKFEPELYYRGKRLSHYDAVIPRVGASITFFGLAVVRQFEQMGVYTPNGSLDIARSRDKLRSMQILSKHDVGIPPTAFVRDKNDVLPAIERLGGAPVIIKLIEGTQGVGVILADSVKIAQAIVETLHSAKQNVLVQKFIKESKGTDIRAIVVGDRVIAAMRRRATGDEFRSNVHRGGKTEEVKLDHEYERTAVRAAQIMGLRFAGVDLLEGEDGPQVMEVNSSPGLEGIETATGVDVAKAVIEDIEHAIFFPEVDLRQRLRFTGGYGVVEFTVHDMPDIEGKKLRDTDLTNKNVYVMNITRGSQNIPNPQGDTVIEKGDDLICYGELAQLSAMMPSYAKRRKIKQNKRKKKTSKDN